MKIQKRKAISAFGLDLTSFPLTCMFLASLLVLGQTATAQQNENAFGLTNIFASYISPFTDSSGNLIVPNLNNVTIQGSTTVLPQQSSSNSCPINTGVASFFFPFGITVALLLRTGCAVVSSIQNVVSSIFFGALVTSGNPSNVQIGFLTIILFLMGAILITGISVLGTGLNTASVFLLFQMGGYVLIWLLLSTISFPIFNGTVNSIPQPYGNLFFLVLTGLYTFGIFRRVT